MLTPSSKYLLLIEAFWYLLKWDRIINKRAFKDWQQHLNIATTPAKTEKSLSLSDIQNLRKAIDAIVRRSPRPLNCMRRCLALKTMIERRGEQCQLHIGVKFEHSGSDAQSKQLKAHAWITSKGTVINDNAESLSQYQEITHHNVLFTQAINAEMPD